MRDTEFCFTHNPETREARKEAVIKGGSSPKKNYNPLPPLEIGNTKDVVKLLGQTINEVRQGIIDLRVANCVGYLAGHLIKALEVADLEDRVVSIEETLKTLNK
jgi:hypothetical protein